MENPNLRPKQGVVQIFAGRYMECVIAYFENPSGSDDSDTDSVDSPSEDEAENSPDNPIDQITPGPYRLQNPETLTRQTLPERGSGTDLRPRCRDRRSSERSLGLRMACQLDGWKWGPLEERRRK